MSQPEDASPDITSSIVPTVIERHTPGPWHVTWFLGGFPEVASREKSICNLDELESDYETKANAILISLSPAMAEVVVSIAKMLKETGSVEVGVKSRLWDLIMSSSKTLNGVVANHV